jgi:hypothetical protein
MGYQRGGKGSLQNVDWSISGTSGSSSISGRLEINDFISGMFSELEVVPSPGE